MGAGKFGRSRFLSNKELLELQFREPEKKSDLEVDKPLDATVLVEPPLETLNSSSGLDDRGNASRVNLETVKPAPPVKKKGFYRQLLEKRYLFRQKQRKKLEARKNIAKTEKIPGKPVKIKKKVKSR